MSIATSPTVYIVTVAHNRKASTLAFCNSLRSQSYSRFVLVLVDDGSNDGTSEAVRAYEFAKQICTGDGNLWWAGGLRRGLARVSALGPSPDDLVLIANDDTIFDPDFLACAVEEMNGLGPGKMMCVSVSFTDSGRWTDGGTVCYWPGLTFHHYGKHPERIDCASTRCLFAFHSDLKICGSFRPRLLQHYLSDYEFTIRARRRGIELMPARNVICRSTELTTGLHGLKPGSFRKVAAQMLSPRFSANPLALFFFVLMAAPFFWKFAGWLWALRTVLVFFVKATILDRLRAQVGPIFLSQ